MGILKFLYPMMLRTMRHYCLLNIELESIKKGRLNRRLIESAKQQKKSEDILSLGNMSSLVERASLSMLYSHRVDFFEKYATQFESVTKICKKWRGVFLMIIKKITTIVWPEAH